MAEFIQVSETESLDDSVELFEVKTPGRYVALETLRARFTGATGLHYKINQKWCW